MFLVLIIVTLVELHAVVHADKRQMKSIAHAIILELHSGEKAGRSLEESLNRVEGFMRFLNRHDDLTYAIVRKPNEILRCSDPQYDPLNQPYLLRIGEFLFLERIDSGKTVEDLYSHWHFTLRYEDPKYTVHMRNASNYELLEKVLGGALGAAGVALFSGLLLGWLLSRQVTAPIERIASVMQSIRAGDLSARAKELGSGDELDQLARTLNQTLEALQQSIDRIRQFSFDAAHELNTPLTVIRGNLELCLTRERTREEIETALLQSIDEIAGLSRMVRSLLLIAAPTDPTSPRELSPLSARQVLEPILEQLLLIAEGKQVKLQVDFPENLVGNGNCSLLERLFFNLIHNAIRFSEADQTVLVTGQAENHELVVRVKDQGRGIAAEHQPRIFERFYQVEPDRHKGTGLGLAIAKWVVDYHRGTISVESREGEGTIFTVRLPGGDAAPVQRGEQAVPAGTSLKA